MEHLGFETPIRAWLSSCDEMLWLRVQPVRPLRDPSESKRLCCIVLHVPNAWLDLGDGEVSVSEDVWAVL